MSPHTRNKFPSSSSSSSSSSSFSSHQQLEEGGFFPCRLTFRLVFVLVAMATIHVSGEASSRLVEPPARPSLWRYGFGTPVDFRDDQVNCGGFDRQYGGNGGRCGVCGDPWDEVTPRTYEAGSSNTLNPRPVRVYRMGGDIPVVIDSSAHLLGQYEFRLCPLNFSEETPDQACFDSNPLPIRESELGLTYRIGQSGGLVSLHLVLPGNFTCVHCLLQWRHVTGSRVNKESCVQCITGVERCNFCQGCGQQEWFQSCSDIAIYDVAGSHPASRGTLTSAEVRQRWEQTVRDARADCPCTAATTTTSSAINVSSTSSVSTPSHLSGSSTVSVAPPVTTAATTSTTTPTTTTTSTTTSTTTPTTTTTAAAYFFTTTTTTTTTSIPPTQGGVSTLPHVIFTLVPTPLPPRPSDTTLPGGGGPIINPRWPPWSLTPPPTPPPPPRVTTTTTTTVVPVRVCYVPYRPPWYLFNAHAWCFRNCPRSGSVCGFRTCRPVRCPSAPHLPPRVLFPPSPGGREGE